MLTLTFRLNNFNDLVRSHKRSLARLKPNHLILQQMFCFSLHFWLDFTSKADQTWWTRKKNQHRRKDENWRMSRFRFLCSKSIQDRSQIHKPNSKIRLKHDEPNAEFIRISLGRIAHDVWIYCNHVKFVKCFHFQNGSSLPHSFKCFYSNVIHDAMASSVLQYIVCQETQDILQKHSSKTNAVVDIFWIEVTEWFSFIERVTFALTSHL